MTEYIIIYSPKGESTRLTTLLMAQNKRHAVEIAGKLLLPGDSILGVARSFVPARKISRPFIMEGETE